MRVFRSTITAATAAAAIVSANVGLAASSFGTPVSIAPVVTSISSGDGSATVQWTPGTDGTATITSYAIVYTDQNTGRPIFDGATGSATSATTTGLTNGTSYGVIVDEYYSSKDVGVSQKGEFITPAAPAPTAPGAPTGVTGSAGNSAVDLSWDDAIANGSAVTGYTIAYTDTTSASGSGTQASGPDPEATITGLVPGDHYTFTVTATNGIGTGPASTASAAVVPFSDPGAPTAVTATGGNASATVNWTPPAADGFTPVTYYYVLSTDITNPAGHPAFDYFVAAPASSKTIPNLVNGDTYTFAVSAANSGGVGPDSAPSASTPVGPTPGAPTAVHAAAGTTLATADRASVSWTAPAGNGGAPVSAYAIAYTDTTSTGHNGTFASPGTGTAATVTGLRAGDAYTFTVSAINAVGPGTPSAATSAVTPVDVPAVPGGVSATAGPAPSAATVDWTAPAAHGSALTGYTIQITDITDPNRNTTQAAAAGATSGTVTGLHPGDSYSFAVLATNAIGTSAASDPSGAVTAFTTPGEPGVPTATGGNGSAALTWTAPATDGGSPVTGYLLRYTDALNPGDSGSYPSKGPGLSATIPGLVGGETYTFTVTAINVAGGGTASPASSPLAVQSAPGSPTAVTATPGPGGRQASIAWTAPSADGGSAITGYTITLDDGVETPTTVTVGPGQLSTVIDGLVAGPAYVVTVVATNALGDSTPATASGSVTAYTSPGAPTLVSGTRGDGTVALDWTAPVADGGSALIGYTITYTDTKNPSGSGSYTPKGVGTSATVPGLANGDSYTFVVTATNAAGAGTDSAASAPVTPATEAGAPTAVTATAGASSARLTWTAPGSDGGSAITGYTITYTDTDNPAHDGTFPSPGPGTSATVPGLVPGGHYTFAVTATNDVGAGAASDPSAAVAPFTIPGTPTSVTATAADGSADLSWSAPEDGGSAVTGYTITYLDSTDPTGDGYYLVGSGTSATVPNLVPGHSYTFTVSATNLAGEGAATATTGPVTPYTTPGAPTLVTGTRGNGTVALSWTAPVGDGGSAITGYAITYIDITRPAGSGSYTPTGTGASATVATLTNGDSYLFVVRAVNAAGAGNSSDPSAAVTPATTPGVPTGVTATADSSAADLDWTVPVSNGGSVITGYTITYVDSDNALGDGTLASAGTGTSATVPSLIPGDHYTFTVTASNDVGSGTTSGSSSAVSPYRTPGAPTAAVATAGSSSAVLIWTAPADGGSPITGYTVTYTDITDPTRNGSVVLSGTATSATVMNLVPGDRYTFAVVATNAAGDGFPSPATAAVAPYTAPDAPTLVTGTRGNGSVTLSWTAPAGDGDSPITGYAIVYTDTTDLTGSGTFSPTGTGTSATIGSLTNGDAYTFTVRAINLAGPGTASAATGPVTPATNPGAPTGLTVSPGDATATVGWTAPASTGGSAITGYTIGYTDTTNGAGSGTYAAGTGTSATVPLVLGDRYTFTVTATNDVGSGPASAASAPFRVIQTAGSPTSVSATTGPDGAPVLTWTAPSFTGGSPVTGYTITATDSTHPDDSGSSQAGAGASPFTVTGLIAGDSYTFTVTATTEAGSGAASAATGPVTAYTHPGAPTWVSLVAVPGGSVARWGGPAGSGGSPVLRYLVSYNDLTTPANSATHVVGAQARTDSLGLVVGDAYTVTVAAINAYGTGPVSFPFTGAVTPYSTAGAPTGVVAAAGPGSATVAWTAPAGDGHAAISGYWITATDTRTHATRRIAVSAATRSADVSGLTAGDPYAFAVTAANAAGLSDPSASSGAVTPLSPVPPKEFPQQLIAARLIPRFGVGLHPTLAPFSLELLKPGAVIVSLVQGTTVVDSTTVTGGGGTVSGSVRVTVHTVARLGRYSWVVRDAVTGDVLGRAPVVLKQNSFLGLRATRSGKTLTLLGAAKWASLDRSQVLPWIGRTIEVQRFTRQGWVTIRTMRTDGVGHINLTLTIASRVGLRLVDADTTEIVGVTSNSPTR